MESSQSLFLLVIAIIGAIGVYAMFQMIKALFDLIIKAVLVMIFLGVSFLFFTYGDSLLLITDKESGQAHIPNEGIQEEKNDPELGLLEKELRDRVNSKKPSHQAASKLNNEDLTQVFNQVVDSPAIKTNKVVKAPTNEKEESFELRLNAREAVDHQLQDFLDQTRSLSFYELDYCKNLSIPNAYYVVVESFFSEESNAINRVAKLKEIGFSRAGYFFAPCYNTRVKKELFIVTISRPCRSKDSIDRKLTDTKKKFLKENFQSIAPQIIQVYRH